MDTASSCAEPPTGSAQHAWQGIAEHVVGAAVWAPSIHNTQPWLFEAGGAHIDLHADPSRQLTVADPDGREMIISCGAALFTARLALRSLAHIPEARILPDPAKPLLVARIGWRPGPAPTDFEQRLFANVPRRRTHRGGFGPLPLSPQLVGVLQEHAGRDGASLRIISDQGGQALLADITQKAEQALQSSSAHNHELDAWVRPPGSTRRDGLPVTSYPPDPPRTFPHFPARDFAHGHEWGVATVSSAPQARFPGLVCVLATQQDRPEDWVNAGQALQRILLTSVLSGVAAALHSQPLELAWAREAVRARFCDGAYPQMVMRLGTVIQNSASVRRPAASVLVTDGSEDPSI